jgi:hypothetical protein
MKNVYVNFTSGTSGEFVIGLLMSMLFDDEIHIAKINSGIYDNGSCHNIRTRLQPEIVSIPSNKQNELLQLKFTLANYFALIKTGKKLLDENYGKIVKCHIPIDMSNLLFEYSDDVHLVNIVPDSDGKQWFTNWLDKAVLGEWAYYGQEALSIKLKTDKKFNLPLKLSNEQIQILVKDKEQAAKILIDDAIAIQQQHKDNCTVLSLTDIYHNKDKVISVLESITGHTRTQLTIDFYDAYLNAQKDFSSIDKILEL